MSPNFDDGWQRASHGCVPADCRIQVAFLSDEMASIESAASRRLSQFRAAEASSLS